MISLIFHWISVKTITTQRTTMGLRVITEIARRLAVIQRRTLMLEIRWITRINKMEGLGIKLTWECLRRKRNRQAMGTVVIIIQQISVFSHLLKVSIIYISVVQTSDLLRIRIWAKYRGTTRIKAQSVVQRAIFRRWKRIILILIRSIRWMKSA